MGSPNTCAPCSHRKGVQAKGKGHSSDIHDGPPQWLRGKRGLTLGKVSETSTCKLEELELHVGSPQAHRAHARTQTWRHTHTHRPLIVFSRPLVAPCGIPVMRGPPVNSETEKHRGQHVWGGGPGSLACTHESLRFQSQGHTWRSVVAPQAPSREVAPHGVSPGRGRDGPTGLWHSRGDPRGSLVQGQALGLIWCGSGA